MTTGSRFNEKYRDESQKQLALATLMAYAGLSQLWSKNGPKQGALTAAFASPHEQILIQAAFDIHAQTSVVRMGEIAELPAMQQVALLGLLKAALSGPEQIEQWIRKTEMRTLLERGSLPTQESA